MPEGTPPDYEAFRPIGPTLVAWGEDALATLDGGDKARQMLAAKFAAYRRIGATAVATNVWMLTATERYLHDHPDLADTSCIDLWGERIVPAWLADADDRGTKAWWGCTNEPRYQQHLVARLRAGLSAGATLVHLDDHSGTFACATGAGGCFCPRCLEGFRMWLRRHGSADELQAAGVSSVEDFDYAAFLRRRGYANRDAFIHACWAGQVPLWPQFLAFQRDAARSFVARLHAEAETIAGRPVPVGVNAYNLQSQQLFDADLVDYFANEVEQHGVEDLVPPVVYRLGEALGRPVFATGTGEDWVAFRRAKSVNRVRGWIAEAYAFGQYFMYSWDKWGFSKETGTVWTQVPTTVYAPMCDFVRDHAALLDGFENQASVGLLYDNRSVQKDAKQLRAISKALLEAGIPYRLVVVGDENLRRAFVAGDLGGLKALVIPDSVTLSGEAARAVAQFERDGGHIARSSGSIAGIQSDEQIRCAAAVKVWALPRYRSRASTSAEGFSRVIHLLNRNYDEPTDAFAPQRAFTVTINGPSGAASPRRAMYYAPGAPATELAIISGEHGEHVVTVPALDVWGILAIQ